MHRQAAPPPPTSDSEAIALQIAIEARLKLLDSSQISNVREDVEQTRPILESEVGAKTPKGSLTPPWRSRLTRLSQPQGTIR